MISQQLNKAISLAKKHHQGQKRKSGEDYIEHPLRVVEILKKHGFNGEILVAAILHDMCEDTKISNIELAGMFGERVGFIINALSKNRKPKVEEGKKCLKKASDFDSRFLMYINRFYGGVLAEPWIMFIKIADQIDNLSTMQPFTQEKKERKLREVEDYFLPMYEDASESLDPESRKLYLNLKSEVLKVIEEVKEGFS